MKLYREFSTPEQIDQQYNIEAAVGDMRPYEWLVGGSATEFAQPGKNHLTAIGGFAQADSALCCALMDFIAGN